MAQQISSAPDVKAPKVVITADFSDISSATSLDGETRHVETFLKLGFYGHMAF